MDQETLRQVHNILHSIIRQGMGRVGFMLNQNGRLIAHVGSSPSFHPQARFSEMTEGEEGENVYMSGIEDRYIVGVVFGELVTMETVRDAVEAARPQLTQVLSPYLPR